MTTATIPLPVASEISAPFWAACRENRLIFQRCRGCNAAVFIPSPCCTACMSGDLAWEQSSGRGSIYSYSVVWRPQQPAFEPGYVAAIVQLDEGWKMLSNVVECDPSAVTVGMPVEVVFRRMSDEITLPYFRPAG
jgi:uncharacterized OB-fold protein